MPRTAEELVAAAAATEVLLDAIDVGKLETDDISDLRRIAAALDTIAGGETELQVAVDVARANGWSWARIGAVLGTSRQAAAERFGRRTAATS